MVRGRSTVLTLNEYASCYQSRVKKLIILLYCGDDNLECLVFLIGQFILVENGFHTHTQINSRVSKRHRLRTYHQGTSTE